MKSIAALLLLALCATASAAATSPRRLLQIPNYHSVCVPTAAGGIKFNVKDSIAGLAGEGFSLDGLCGAEANVEIVSGSAHINFALNAGLKEQQGAFGICLKVQANLAQAVLRETNSGVQYKLSAAGGADGVLLFIFAGEEPYVALPFNVKLVLNAHAIPNTGTGPAPFTRARVNIHLSCAAGLSESNLGGLFGSCKPSSFIRASIECGDNEILP